MQKPTIEGAVEFLLAMRKHPSYFQACIAHWREAFGPEFINQVRKEYAKCKRNNRGRKAGAEHATT